MATTDTTPTTDLFQLAFQLPSLEPRWYTDDYSVLTQQRANIELLGENFGTIDLDRYPEVHDQVTVVRLCVEEYKEWLRAFEECRASAPNKSPRVTRTLISQVMDLVEQISNLQICYDATVDQCGKICQCLCPEVLRPFDLPLELVAA